MKGKVVKTIIIYIMRHRFMNLFKNNTGVVSTVVRLKTQDLTSQYWTTPYNIAGVDIARLLLVFD